MCPYFVTLNTIHSRFTMPVNEKGRPLLGNTVCVSPKQKFIIEISLCFIDWLNL